MLFRKTLPTLSLLGLLALGTGCNDFLDVNTDPLNPTQVESPLLLAASQAAMSTYLGQSVNGLSQPTSAIMQQLVNTRIGSYTLTGQSFENEWAGLYTDALSNNEQIIRQSTASQQWAYVGIAQIQKAYMFSQMVDMWGDIPYSEALQGAANRAPRYDDDAQIYDDLFRLLDEGIANLAKAPNSTISGDLIYNGNLTRWRQLASTIKLKLYNQVRLVRNVQQPVAALLTAGDLLPSGGDFEFRYGASTQPDNRNLGFIGDYANSGRENSINPRFFQLMKSRTDPRIPYYFYNQVTSTVAQTVDFQDGKFISTRFGSVGPNAATNNSSLRTLQGLYPIGGKYDNNAGGLATQSSGKGVVAQRFLPFFSRKFIEAELQLMVLSNPTAARQAYEEGIRAAFDKVNAIATADGSPVISATSISTYVTAALTRYTNAATDTDKLRQIMTEKYIASFGSGLDLYTDYRRTNLAPVIISADDDNDAQTVATGPFPLRLPYRQSDLLANPNAPAQVNVATDRIFWDPN
ncbi:SusD/RagB family nutrient-binding outer membrane lipoprotein [Hymenobacter metallilatus]|uniref:SusD/RagB family nutrient-binding outer membrane lipoprotein n=1 Tax=Hymenobacter metallilatus TaxID=2493666 RepID=A0A428IZ41_9BACT|nr:SusD/RagB family nutrient-binding outer membrane lipoprotein [Hymenobacter metallilatus]RSK24277.1 SusD/RagB family nutrient-binding outer membrane lipoprotein [Hymenobacter metallilatus]